MATRQEQLNAQIAAAQGQIKEFQKVQAEKGAEAMVSTAGGQFMVRDVLSDVTGRLSGMQAELAAEQKREQQFRGRVQTGTQIGRELVGDLGRATTGTQVSTALGRADVEKIREDAIRQGRSADVAEIIARRRQALSGFSGEETEARRSQAAGEIGRATETQRRRLQAIQAQTGVRGGTAAAQQMQALQQGVKTRAEFERDLFLANEQAKRDALSAFESSVTGAERSEFERQAAGAELQKFNILQRSSVQQFNLGQELRERELQRQNLQAAAEQERFNLQQQAKERFGAVGVGMGFASLAAGDEATDKAVAAQQAASAAASSGGK